MPTGWTSIEKHRDKGKTYELLLEIFSTEKLNNRLFVP